MTDYDDEMEHVFREVTKGSDSKSDPCADLESEQEGSRLKREQGLHPECDPPIRPLCRECVRDLPDASGLCTFCRVVLS